MALYFRIQTCSVLLPVPQAFSLARHTEAVPIVGEVAANKQNRENCDESE